MTNKTEEISKKRDSEKKPQVFPKGQAKKKIIKGTCTNNKKSKWLWSSFSRILDAKKCYSSGLEIYEKII